VIEIILKKDDIVKSISFNLPVVDEPGLAGAVKRKWRERLQSRGIRLVLSPAVDGLRWKESYENIGLHNFTGRR